MATPRPFLTPVAFIDSPQVLDCSVTSIPGSGSSPLQVVSSLKKSTAAVRIIDSLGEYVGLYVGKAGFEVLTAIIGAGAPDYVECVIPKGSRVTLRNMATTAISTGSVCITFLGIP